MSFPRATSMLPVLTWGVTVRQTIAILLLLFLSLCKLQAQTAGCGKGTDQSQCGNVGGSFSTTGQTPISACNLALGAGSYYLSADVTATPYLTNTAEQSACFGLAHAGITLNLNGHTVTGGIYANSTAQDTELYNGTIVHDIEYGQTIAAGMVSYAGIDLTSLGCPASSPLKLHHLTITPGTDASFNVMVTFSPASQCLVNPTGELYNITTTAPTNGSTSRSANFYLLGSPIGYDPFSVSYNLMTCPGGANACQGIVFYNAAESLAFNNDITMSQNTTGADGRGIIFDGDGAPTSATWYTAGNVTGCSGCVGYNNTVTANNNRCFRIRDSINAVYHDNECLSVIDPGEVAGAHCFHIGDPDNGDNDLQAYQIYNNTCDLGASVYGIHFIRAWDSTGNAKIYNNTYTCNSSSCAGAYAAVAVQPQGTGTRSIMTIENENTSALPGQASTNYMVLGGYGRGAAQSGNLTADTVTVNYCNVGMTGIQSLPTGAVTPALGQVSCPPAAPIGLTATVN